MLTEAKSLKFSNPTHLYFSEKKIFYETVLNKFQGFFQNPRETIYNYLSLKSSLLSAIKTIFFNISREKNKKTQVKKRSYDDGKKSVFSEDLQTGPAFEPI